MNKSFEDKLKRTYEYVQDVRNIGVKVNNIFSLWSTKWNLKEDEIFFLNKCDKLIKNRVELNFKMYDNVMSEECKLNPEEE